MQFIPRFINRKFITNAIKKAKNVNKNGANAIFINLEKLFLK